MGMRCALKTLNRYPRFFIMSIEGAFYALELATTDAEVQEVLDFIDQELN